MATLPFHSQDTRDSCGAACLQMIHHWHLLGTDRLAEFRPDQTRHNNHQHSGDPSIFEEAEGLPLYWVPDAVPSTTASLAPWQLAGWLNLHWTTATPASAAPPGRRLSGSGSREYSVPSVVAAKFLEVRKWLRSLTGGDDPPPEARGPWTVAEENSLGGDGLQDLVAESAKLSRLAGVPSILLVTYSSLSNHWVVLKETTSGNYNDAAVVYYDPWLPQDSTAADPRTEFSHQQSTVCWCGNRPFLTAIRASVATNWAGGRLAFSQIVLGFPMGKHDRSPAEMAADIAAADLAMSGTQRAHYGIVPKTVLDDTRKNLSGRSDPQFFRRSGPVPTLLEQLVGLGLTGSDAQGEWGRVSAKERPNTVVVKTHGTNGYTLHFWAPNQAGERLAAITSAEGWLVDAAVLTHWPDPSDILSAAQADVAKKHPGSVVEAQFFWKPGPDSASPYWPLLPVTTRTATGTRLDFLNLAKRLVGQDMPAK